MGWGGVCYVPLCLWKTLRHNPLLLLPCVPLTLFFCGLFAFQYATSYKVVLETKNVTDELGIIRENVTELKMVRERDVPLVAPSEKWEEDVGFSWPSKLLVLSVMEERPRCLPSPSPRATVPILVSA